MIVCVCNNVNSESISESITKGNNTPGKVAKDCEFRFQCGNCKCTIVEQIVLETINDKENTK